MKELGMTIGSALCKLYMLGPLPFGTQTSRLMAEREKLLSVSESVCECRLCFEVTIGISKSMDGYLS